MERFEIFVDGQSIEVEEGTTVASVLLNAGYQKFRLSVSGQPRGLLCAMGICFECLVTIDGIARRRACLETCRPGIQVETGG